MRGRQFACLGLTALTAAGCSGSSTADSEPTRARVGLDVSGRLAVTAQRGEVDSIAVRDLSGGPVRIISLPRYRGKAVDINSIVWSPNADRIAYSDSAGRVFVVSASGARRRMLLPAAPNRRVDVTSGWSPNGRTLAVASMRYCAAGEPRLLLVDVASKRSRRLPAHPPGAPAASTANPAFIGPVAWSPDGTELLYAWSQYRDGDCRNMGGSNRPVRVMRIGATGTPRIQLAAQLLIFSFAWSPSGSSIALLRRCLGIDPLAWTTDEREVVVATDYDDCGVSTRDRSGRAAAPEASLWPPTEDAGTVVYAVAAETGVARVQETFGDEDDCCIGALGTAPRGEGIVAWGETGFVLIPLDGSPVQQLPPLTLPRGMTAVEPAAGGFFPNS